MEASGSHFCGSSEYSLSKREFSLQRANSRILVSQCAKRESSLDAADLGDFQGLCLILCPSQACEGDKMD